MKTRILSVTATFAALCAGTGVGAQWQETRWGMTPEEVAAAMNGAAPLSRGSRGDRLDGKTIGNVGEYRLGGARFRAVYYYDAAGLAHVGLYRRSGDCRQILMALEEMHGRPARISDQTIFRLIIWHDRPAGNRIRLLASQNLCDLNYERLSDYEEIDLQAGRPQ